MQLPICSKHVVMYEPLKSMKPNLTNGLDQALEAGQLTLSQFERLTQLTLSQIQRHTNFVEDQLEAAAHLQDPSNWLQFFQDQFSTSNQMAHEVAQALFELSQEFHTELNTLV